MAIITKVFTITTNLLTELIIFDTDAVLLKTSITNSYTGTSSIVLNIRELGAIKASIALQFSTTTSKSTPIQAGSSISVQHTGATVSLPSYVTLSYYYDDGEITTVNPAGVWNSATTYPKNSIVYRDTNSTSYIANISNVNQAPESNPSTWQVITGQGISPSISLSSELVSVSTPGFINLNTTDLGVGNTLSNKTLTDARFTNNRFFNSAGTYHYTFPLSDYNEILVDTGSSQTLSNKTLLAPTITSAGIDGSSISLTSGSRLIVGNGFIRDSVSNSIPTTTSYLVSLANGGLQRLSTPGTNSAIIQISLPVASATPGACIMFFVTMVGADQLISWNNAKIASDISPSTAAGRVDIYSAICDGSFWYLTQVEKGFI